MSTVIIDDQAAAVTHTGAWQFGGLQQEFQKTVSTSNTPGSAMKLQFHGSEISVYGTLGTYNATNMSFQVDSTWPQMYTANGNLPFSQFHTNLFAQSSLSLDSPHTLVITQINSPDASSLGIDCLLVSIPDTENSTISDDGVPQMVMIDDTSPQVSYFGSWNAHVGTMQDMQGTLHGAKSPGSHASLSFAGSQISIFGNIHLGSSGLLATFMLDGHGDSTSKGVTFAVPTSPAPEFALNVSSNTLMFNASGLEEGNHTLVMAAQGSGFFFDYAIVTGSMRESEPSTSGSNVSATSSTPFTTTTAIVGTGSRKRDVALIVGCVVGSVIDAIALLILLFWIRCWRRRKRPNILVQDSSFGLMGAGPLGRESRYRGDVWATASPSDAMALFQANQLIGGLASAPYAAELGAQAGVDDDAEEASPPSQARSGRCASPILASLQPPPGTLKPKSPPPTALCGQLRLSSPRRAAALYPSERRPSPVTTETLGPDEDDAERCSYE